VVSLARWRDGKRGGEEQLTSRLTEHGWCCLLCGRVFEYGANLTRHREREHAAALESQNDAAEIRLRSERRLGELTRELPKAKGSAGPGRGKAGHKSGPAFSSAPTLATRGIKKQDAHRWQQLEQGPAAND
jgi:hypothetical protein